MQKAASKYAASKANNVSVGYNGRCKRESNVFVSDETLGHPYLQRLCSQPRAEDASTVPAGLRLELDSRNDDDIRATDYHRFWISLFSEFWVRRKRTASSNRHRIFHCLALRNNKQRLANTHREIKPRCQTVRTSVCQNGENG